ncbi:Fungal specific transcription factor domain-containing protein isoform 1 [Cladophialophora immunda]|nr:Fungal specific transcription factor domain-containing protein isoform 1 [Cladophialophora immunda]
MRNGYHQSESTHGAFSNNATFDFENLDFDLMEVLELESLPNNLPDNSDAMDASNSHADENDLPFETVSPSGRRNEEEPIGARTRRIELASEKTALDHDPPPSVVSRQLARFVGPTGDLDLYLLAYRQYDQRDQSESQHTNVIYQRMKPDRNLPEPNTGELPLPPPVFTLHKDPYSSRLARIVEDSPVERFRTELKTLISDNLVSDLVRLWFRFVYPYFPILTRQQIFTQEKLQPSVSPSLLAALSATAIPFSIYDDKLCVEGSRLPSSTDLLKISLRALAAEVQSPRLETVQTLLLLLQRHPTGDPLAEEPLNWNLCAQMTSTAQTIGLNHDPMSWTSLPLWERRLRKLIWWAVWVCEKWTAFGQGMPSHLHDRDCTCQPLTEADLADLGTDAATTPNYFLHFVQLTTILDRLMNSFFTAQATLRLANDVQGAIDAAKVIRAQLKEWHDALPAALQTHAQSDKRDPATVPRQDLDGQSSLRLAYVVAQLAVFRALLRPVSMVAIHRGSGQGLPDKPVLEPDAARAIVRGAITCLEELVEFVEGLTTIQWDAFWHGWSRHNFSIASTLLMHLLLITAQSHTSPIEPHEQWPSPQDHQPRLDPVHAESTSQMNLQTEHEELRKLTQRWRWALRLAAQGAGGRKGLMTLSLLRIDALFIEWQDSNIL